MLRITHHLIPPHFHPHHPTSFLFTTQRMIPKYTPVSNNNKSPSNPPIKTYPNHLSHRPSTKWTHLLSLPIPVSNSAQQESTQTGVFSPSAGPLVPLVLKKVNVKNASIGI